MNSNELKIYAPGKLYRTRTMYHALLQPTVQYAKVLGQEERTDKAAFCWPYSTKTTRYVGTGEDE